jgi:competence protein ComEA
MQAGFPRGRHAAPTVVSGPRLWRTWTPTAARAVALVLVAVLAVVAWWWWQGRPREVEGIGALAPSEAPVAPGVPADVVAAAEVVTVHVIGRVRRPGVVELPLGSRVEDAIAAAGGLSDPRLRTDLNFARTLLDGEQVIVRRSTGSPTGSTSSGGEAGPVAGPINLNTADSSALQSLPGIGPVLADRIIAWREANGPFPTVDVLGEVSGIGPTLLENLRPLVRV